MADVKVNLVEPQIDITVDLSKLTWGDLLNLQRVVGSQITEGQAIEMISAIVTKVTDRNANDLPAVAMQAILQAIFERAHLGDSSAKN